MQIGWQRGKEGGILLAEPNFLGRDERERLCQLMFEVGGWEVWCGEGGNVLPTSAPVPPWERAASCCCGVPCC